LDNKAFDIIDARCNHEVSIRTEFTEQEARQAGHEYCSVLLLHKYILILSYHLHPGLPSGLFRLFVENIQPYFQLWHKIWDDK